jgi:hypothetical protein
VRNGKRNRNHGFTRQIRLNRICDFGGFLKERFDPPNGFALGHLASGRSDMTPTQKKIIAQFALERLAQIVKERKGK